MKKAPYAQQRHRRIAGAAAACCALVAAGFGLAPAHAASGPGTTVAAPGAGPNATVTVSRTTGLVNQSVAVSWTGFTPSSANVLNNGNGTYDTDTRNPVRVYECRGANPASSSDCYGSPGYAGVNAISNANGDYPAVPPQPGYTYKGQTTASEINPDGPANFEDTVSDANGKGSVVIQIFTKLESPTLGCGPTAPCSIVVVPNYGRPDNAPGGAATEDNLDAPWAWADRTVVPVTFGPVGATCSLSKSPLTVEGSPIDARLMASWQVGTCTSKKDPVDVNYTAIGEPESRSDFASGVADVGLTTLPLTTKPTIKPAYAPVSLSSLVVAFQVDDANGRPITHMNLDARLVAKIITASYRVAADSDVSTSAPFNLFHDPEFLALNPGVQWPEGTPGNHPILLGDESDLTYELTSWINNDPAARAFLNGKPDPYGMTVNAAYKGIKLPLSTFPSLDPNQANAFQPIQGLDQVARQLSIAQFPGGTTDVEAGSGTVVTKYPRQNPGAHEVIGILDAADADDFLTHTAKLRNADGKFVGPTNYGILAAARHMTVGANGVTRTANFTAKDPAAYPLPIVSTAIVPTGTGTGTAESTAIAHFLGYASGAGEVAGTALGQLPAGYVPLPNSLRTLDAKAIKAVTATKSTKPEGSGKGGKKNHPNLTSDSSTPTSTLPTPTGGSLPTTTATSPAPGPVVAGTPPASTGTTSAATPTTLAAVKSSTAATDLLPYLLGTGLLSFLVGPLVLWGRRPAPHKPTRRKPWPLW